ncbi:MAG: hypothetical protein H6724_05045 [Sandaracinus sp.]|nr:hypothetical protein [Sandaracinus sp.]
MLLPARSFVFSVLIVAACAGPDVSTEVRCGAMHADGRTFECLGAIEHESIFPTRWWLEVDALEGTTPVWLDGASVEVAPDAACRLDRDPRCAVGVCTIVLRQDEHGFCGARLRLDSDLGPLQTCWTGVRSFDEATYRADVRAARRACR